MERSISDLILQQRTRLDAMAMLAGRFLDEPAQKMIERLSGRMARVGATLTLPTARQQGIANRLQGHLERLVRAVSLARVDDRESVSRVAWVLAEIEEAIRQSPVEVIRPVYISN
ncbi:hypothetical protein [Humisphaera borealis]|uniref:Uncharacterized protein n=1 Tax=Humisphaera borealis TaxID=2807512 RepID=A0A7M2WVV6_9BACT|nr:hypothetical protein [Humisphaera borealis]QOV89625.1 hypothetical protein IPV69_26120 [Humisphaera borealis]